MHRPGIAPNSALPPRVDSCKKYLMPTLELKPEHKPIQNYFTDLRQFGELGVSHEVALTSASCSLSASIGERVRVRCRFGISDFSQKQQFLNTVYKKYFQCFCVKVAYTHGIVYTPPPIVHFVVKTVIKVVKRPSPDQSLFECAFSSMFGPAIKN